MCKFFNTWYPTALTLAVILYATLWPDPVGAEESMLFPGADKLIHAIMMGGLAAAIMFDMRRSGKRLTSKRILKVCLIVLAFSAVDEIAQTSMSVGRTGDILDFLADGGGIAISALTAPPVINRIFRRKPQD